MEIVSSELLHTIELALATSTWYRFDSQGFVTTGLKQIDGALYYFEEQAENQGAMYVNKSFGGYFFGPDGKAIIG